ncbi:MAG: hypothetical protein R3C10_04285 [Pirellulales bacterium]
MDQQYLVSSDDRERLQHFLSRRQLKDRVVELLKEVKESHDLKRGEVTTSQSATYEALVEALATALANKWVEPDNLTSILDDAETAGRQHICIFKVPEEAADAVIGMLRSPRTLNPETARLSDFWSIPLEPYSRILRDDDAGIVVKTVAPRYYWVEDRRQPSEDRIEITKERERERSAIIFKFDKAVHLLECRVPTREKNPHADTSKSVYQFLAEITASEYVGNAGEQAQTLLGLVGHFDLANAFQKIIENRDDFELHKDTPENQDLKTSMSHRASADDAKDIRDYDEWVYENGFARTSIKGKWKREDDSILVHMHDESVKLGKQVSRQVSRIFFPRPCSDTDIAYVVERVRAHF